MDHFTQEKNALAGILIHRSEGDFDGIFHPVTESEMARQIKLYGAQIQLGGRKILFQFILLLPVVFDSGNERTSVYDRNVK